MDISWGMRAVCVPCVLQYSYLFGEPFLTQDHLQYVLLNPKKYVCKVINNSLAGDIFFFQSIQIHLEYNELQCIHKMQGKKVTMRKW